MRRDIADVLRNNGIQPSAQRMVVAEYVLDTGEHPSAEDVWRVAKENLPMISRATVYNTLNLFVAKGLLRELVLSPGRVVFDCNIDRHHHFIDEATGLIHDVPWDAVKVSKLDRLGNYEINEYQVVMRGTKLPARAKRAR
jgi:Fe2+ or Zn2+ uptake regulation protein